MFHQHELIIIISHFTSKRNRKTSRIDTKRTIACIFLIPPNHTSTKSIHEKHQTHQLYQLQHIQALDTKIQRLQRIAPSIQTIYSLKVDPIGPKRILEKVTWAFGLLVSTSSGLPESVEQVPRATPGADGSLSVGNVESSQSMLTAWSSQSDMTRTWPFARDDAMPLSPPRAA